MKEKKTNIRRLIPIALAVLSGLFLVIYLLQTAWAHRNDEFVPDYERLTITEETDRGTLFLQTGLSGSAVDKLIAEDRFEVALELQDATFEPKEAECISLLGWFTREDRREADERITLVDLQPGDILLTFSTHSVGWRHGHAGLVLDEDSVLESVSLGEVSGIMNANHWTTYSNVVVLRVKGTDEALQEEVAAYARETLNGVSYRLLAGWIGEKALETDEPWFGAHCSYLIWYAWNRFGYDLDSDGGRLVSCTDILNSGLVEVVQVYGMDPRRLSEGERMKGGTCPVPPLDNTYKPFLTHYAYTITATSSQVSSPLQRMQCPVAGGHTITSPTFTTDSVPLSL